jgi:hypothetical protein
MTGRRVYFRVSDEQFEAIERAARVAGISVGSMARVCALHWCAFVAAEMKASGREFGRVRAMNGSQE